MHRAGNWIILVLGVLAVPFTHGVLEYFGLILAAILLIGLNTAILRKRARDKDPISGGSTKPPAT
jgi:hypothetical protein